MSIRKKKPARDRDSELKTVPGRSPTLAEMRQDFAEAHARDNTEKPVAGEALQLGLDYTRSRDPLQEWVDAVHQTMIRLGHEPQPDDALSDFQRASRALNLEIWHRRLFGLEVRSHMPLDDSLSLAVSLDRPKTTSLVMDRIWRPVFKEEEHHFPYNTQLPVYPGPYVELLRAPDDVCYCLGHPMEIHYAGLVTSSAYQSLRYLLTNALGKLLETMGGDPWEVPLRDITFSPKEREARFAFLEQMLSALVSRQLQRSAPSLFATTSDRVTAYKRGRGMVLVSVLEGLPIPIEEKLAWIQVMEFRKDLASRDRLRRFARWLDGVLSGKSEAQVTDEILIRLTDYRRALAKHGIETRVGAFERVVSWQPMLAKLTSVVTGVALGEPIAGMIGAGSVAIGEVAVALYRSRLALDKIHEKHEDVSFVFEIEETIHGSNHVPKGR